MHLSLLGLARNPGFGCYRLNGKRAKGVLSRRFEFAERGPAKCARSGCFSHCVKLGQGEKRTGHSLPGTRKTSGAADSCGEIKRPRTPTACAEKLLRCGLVSIA